MASYILKSLLISCSDHHICSKLGILVGHLGPDSSTGSSDQHAFSRQNFYEDTLTLVIPTAALSYYNMNLSNRHVYSQNTVVITLSDIISYPLFADADTGIYPHAASQYHARPKAKRGIA